MWQWVEYLSDKLGTTHENYACGGATVDDTLVQGWVGGKFNEPGKFRRERKRGVQSLTLNPL